MKYEEFKIGESYLLEPYVETVIFKHDKTESIVCEDQKGVVSTYNSDSFEYFEPLKEELPEEGLLVSKLGGLAYKLSDGSGYGFIHGHQSNYIFNSGWNFSNTENWKPATPEKGKKFVEMLKKECEKRGLFEDTKLSECGINSFISAVNKGVYTVTFTPHTAWNKNGKIFHKGKFATPLKEETLELVSKAVKEIGDFIVEQTESGIIILTKINK